MGYGKKTTNRNPGGQMRKKKSEYATQLNEKQKGIDITLDEAQKMYDVKTEIFHSMPTAEIFPGVKEIMQKIKDAGILPSESLFIDDGAGNVQAARQLGFQTYCPHNGEDWRDALTVLLQKS